jgi:hypothetical protein
LKALYGKKNLKTNYLILSIPSALLADNIHNFKQIVKNLFIFITGGSDGLNPPSPSLHQESEDIGQLHTKLLVNQTVLKNNECALKILFFSPFRVFIEDYRKDTIYINVKETNSQVMIHKSRSGAKECTFSVHLELFGSTEFIL